MNWRFAKVNGELAEIYFEKKGKIITILSHCYIKLSDYRTKGEKHSIEEDIKSHAFVYKNRKYTKLYD